MVEDAVYETLDDTDTFEPAEQTPQEVQVISEDDEELYDKTIADGWENLITNGDLEGEGFDNFVVNDYPDPNDKDSKVAVGAPRIIADPANENNKCIIVSSLNTLTTTEHVSFLIRCVRRADDSISLHGNLTYTAGQQDVRHLLCVQAISAHRGNLTAAIDVLHASPSPYRHRTHRL